MTWNKFVMIKTDAEEKKYFGVDEIWAIPIPDNEETVLVSDGISIWLDEWYADLDGANLLNSDALGLYWMPLPELPMQKAKRN